MVEKLAIYEWFFLLLGQVWSVVVYPPSFACRGWQFADRFCVQRLVDLFVLHVIVVWWVGRLVYLFCK